MTDFPVPRRVAVGAAQPALAATATPPTITPTVTPPIGPGPASQIPTLSAGFLVVLGVLVASAAFLPIRRA
ncbi:MAG: hypothetical protein ACM3SU_13845 [Acidobacteriota bacterium]